MRLKELRLGFGLGSEGGELKSEPLGLREEGWGLHCRDWRRSGVWSPGTDGMRLGFEH